ncbi:MAG: hypothetical protein ACLQKH_02590 [Steroidobacteraceae bacterium]
MSDKRETDFLAYILAAFVITIGGIAVGVASTNQVPDNADTSDQAALTMPTEATAAPSASKTPAAHQTKAMRLSHSQQQLL